MRISKSVIIGLIVATLILPVSLSAQETTLSTDQIALIDRAIAARNSLDDVSSYVEVTQGQNRFQVNVQDSESPPPYSNLQVWSREMVVVREQDATIIQALMALAVESTSPDAQVVYEVDAEARLVDDVLYVSANYVDPEADSLPEPLPDGWHVVDDVTSHPVYGDLKLTDLTGAEALFDAPDVLHAAASDVTLTTATDAEGVTTNTIVITIDGPGMIIFMQDYVTPRSSNEALTLAMSDELDASSRLEIEVVLGENDTPLVLRTKSLVRSYGLPGNLVGISDPVARVDIFNDSEREQTYSRFGDATLVPVTSPEVTTP